MDYSKKNIDQLKCQLKNHIILFQTSRMIFACENPNETWQLPANFDKSKCKNFIKNAIN